MKYWGPDKVLAKKREYLIPCVYHFYEKPMQLVRGSMQYIYDQDGKEYVDCFAGVSVVNCGHCNPEIVAALCEQAQTLQHTTTIYLTQPMMEVAEKLAQVTPGSLKRSFFCSSGTEANEGAVLLASLATGKSEIIALEQALHGRTKLTMSLTGLSFWRTDPTPVGGIHFTPNPYCYRCPYHQTYPTCDLACANQIERVLQTATSGQVAAFISEPIQGNGGIITPPPGYFKRVKEILNHYGILLILDEVQTGFGRTGKWFACEHYEVEPDIMTVAKALGNGTPVSAFITTDKIASAYTRPGASTLGGNPVSMAAAKATLNYLEREKLPEKAAELGQYLKTGLLELQKKYPIIGDVRGLGLMVGAELVQCNKQPAIQETDIILEAMKDYGFLIGKNGPNRNVLAFQPPLVITQDNLSSLLNHLETVLSSLPQI